MSPRERNAWIHLLAILIVFVPYFHFVLQTFMHEEAIGRPVLLALIVAAIAYTALSAIGQIVNRIAFGRIVSDERDAAIEARSLRIAYFTILSLVMTALGIMAFLGAVQPPSPTGRIWLPTFSVTSQFVFFCFVVAEVLRHATQIVCYRRESFA